MFMCDQVVNRVLKVTCCVMIFVLRLVLSAVEKWIKQNKLDFLGIPSCVGFGLHADLYRCEFSLHFPPFVMAFYAESHISHVKL